MPIRFKAMDNPLMSRYVFFSSAAHDAKVLSAARKAARSHGAIVVKSLAGTMLLELAPEQISVVAQALPGWGYTAEHKTARVPERRPLERSKPRGALTPTTKG
ncbi:MAG: hypothetical protein QM750_04385 [Rubrivivax sp.]